MSNAHDSAAGDDRDRTKLVWGAIAGAFILMTIALSFLDQPDPNATLVRARHILIAFEKTDPVERQRALRMITGLRERIENGEDFGKLAAEFSDDPGSKGNGGDLGFADPTQYDGSFKDYVTTAKVGQLSEILSTSHGFHIVQLMERQLSDWDARERNIEERIREEEDGGTAPEL